MMKFWVFTVLVMAVFAMHTDVAYAKEFSEYKAEADRYYEEQNFNKAHKVYFKLAKSGDHHSQARLSTMYANGEGKGVDLVEAYAWSVLAAENGSEELAAERDDLLERTGDKGLAQKKAAKLQKKYGKAALKRKAEKRERMKRNQKGGGCTGTKLGCSN